MNKEEFVKECVKEGLIIYGTTWESNFKRLKELKQYKKMWEKLEQDYGEEKLKMQFEEKLNYIMDAIKQRYLPAPVNKIHQLLMELDELVQETLRQLGG